MGAFSKDDAEASEEFPVLKYSIRDATGADWVWLTDTVRENQHIAPQAVIARMVDSLSESAALDLPADEFRDLFAACSRAIVGDDCPD